MSQSDFNEIREVVDQVKNPKSFSIVNVLADRSYPKTTVSISLDEGSAYQAALIKQEIDEYGSSADSKNETPEQRQKIEDLNNKLESLTAEMMAHLYVFHIKGISEGKREEISREAQKKYPVEYEKMADISSLLGGSSERIEKPSPDRDNLFTDLLWKEHIESIEDPDGNVQTNLSYSDIRSLRTNLPLSSLAKINAAIERIRTATAVFMMETGEDFLAKP
jgi:hypothetical protein